MELRADRPDGAARISCVEALTSPESPANSAIFSAVHGETFNCPAEISEARNGLTIDRMEINCDAGGEGEFIGGRGIRLDYRIRRDDSFLTLGYTRSRILPGALDGGREG